MSPLQLERADLKAFRAHKFAGNTQTRAQRKAQEAAQKADQLAAWLEAQAERRIKISLLVSESMKADIDHLNSEDYLKFKHNSKARKDMRRCFRSEGPIPRLDGIDSFAETLAKNPSKLGVLTSYLINNKEATDLRANAEKIQLKLEADIESWNSRVTERLMIWWVLEVFLRG
jgi:hypothetical protein